MTPVFVLTKIADCVFGRNRGYWWLADLTLDGKVIIEDMTMPGHAITHDDALTDAKRIAEINGWEFQNDT